MWEELSDAIISGFMAGAIIWVLFIGYEFYTYFRDLYKQYKKDLAALTVDVTANKE